MADKNKKKKFSLKKLIYNDKYLIVFFYYCGSYCLGFNFDEPVT